MKVQNNVNANPSFGLRLVIKGPVEETKSFVKALEEGFTAKDVPVTAQNCYLDTLCNKAVFQVATENDSLRLALKNNQNIKKQKNGKSDFITCSREINNFFKKADVINIKPFGVRISLKGNRKKIGSFRNALRGGFLAQNREYPMIGISPSEKKEFIATGEEAKKFGEESQNRYKKEGGIIQNFDKLVESFFNKKNIQVIDLDKKY